jgi:hypothetical protein
VAASFSLSGTLRIVPQWTDDLNTTTVTDSATVLLPLTLSNGSGDNQANAFWKDVRTVAASSSDVFNIEAGLPLSVFGGTGSLRIEISKVRLFYIRNLSQTVTLSVVLQDAEETPLPPEAVLLMYWPKGNSQFSAANAGDVNVINGGAAAANYEVVVAGVQQVAP